jgi:hypothetical protein
MDRRSRGGETARGASFHRSNPVDHPSSRLGVQPGGAPAGLLQFFGIARTAATRGQGGAVSVEPLCIPFAIQRQSPQASSVRLGCGGNQNI